MSLAAVGLLGLTQCRLDPECFGTNECSAGSVCFANQCVAGDASTSDAAVGDDAGPTDADVIDAGGADASDTGPLDFGFPDFGFPDANRPDLGFPDAGTGDTGFANGPMPAGANPLVGTSTPTAISTGFIDLQNVTWRTTSATPALILSDLGADVLYELHPNDGNAFAVLNAPANQANGIAVNPATSELTICEQAGQRLTIRSPTGTFLPLVTDYFQHRFHSPNDLAVRADGVLYFTDPPFGLGPRAPDLPFNGLFRVGTLTATITVEWMGQPGVHAPDGIALSPNEDILYMSEVGGRMLLAFDIQANGRLTNRRGFVLTRGVTPNGIVVDDDGNVYVATSIGIEVYAPNGFYWGVIPVPGPISDLTFAPPNRRRIYATSSSSVYEIDVPIAGPLR